MLKSNAALILAAMVATLLFGGLTYWVVERAGGTKVSADYSNTPNATVPGPPRLR
jgi:peptidoglycan/LPS O-acetylase OafA/YrhL